MNLVVSRRLRAKNSTFHNWRNEGAWSPIDLNVRVQLWHLSGYCERRLACLKQWDGIASVRAVLLVMEDRTGTYRRDSQLYCQVLRIDWYDFEHENSLGDARQSRGHESYSGIYDVFHPWASAPPQLYKEHT